MIEIDIPGYRKLQLTDLVSDYNGTLAVDGILLPCLRDLLPEIAAHLRIHVLTENTYGAAAAQLAGLPVQLTVLPPEFQAKAKQDFVKALGTEGVVAIGNGRNDAQMLQAAALGIAVIQREGASAETLRQADVASLSIVDALGLLLNPKRLIATLRS